MNSVSTRDVRRRQKCPSWQVSTKQCFLNRIEFLISKRDVHCHILAHTNNSSLALSYMIHELSRPIFILRGKSVFSITSGIERVQKLNRKRSLMDIFDEARQRGYRAVQNDQELPFLRERERSGTKYRPVDWADDDWEDVDWWALWAMADATVTSRRRRRSKE